MESVVTNTAAQWGAIGMLLLGGIWLVRWLTAQLAAANARNDKHMAELQEAYRANTAALATFSEVLRGYRQ